MTADILPSPPTPQSLPDQDGLAQNLLRLLGAPVQFARLAYGGELQVHFGPLRESRSAKLKDRRVGTYVLGFRASPWVYVHARSPLIIGDGVSPTAPHGDAVPADAAIDDLNRMFADGAVRVVRATPYVWTAGGVGLQLVLTDNSTLTLIPAPPEPGEELADWELFGPQGHLEVGPGLKWHFLPAEAVAA